MTFAARLAITASALSTDPRAAKLARSLGFAGIQYDARSAAFDITTLSQSGRREFRGIISSNDLSPVALRADVGLKGFAPTADIDRLIATLDKVLESAAGLMSGSALVCLDLGPLPEPAVAPPPPKPAIKPQDLGLLILPTSAELAATAAAEPPRPADEPFESSVDAALTALGALADRYGVTVAFRSDLASFAAIERALADARCPLFGVDLDPVAILRDRRPVDEIFGRLGPLVRHVRARDAQAGHDRRTRPTPIGQGTTNWQHLLTLLDDAAYKNWLTIDPNELADRPAAAGAARNYLAALRP